jgi:hypothetical protein
MSGKHDIENHQISVKFPHELFRKIEVRAQEMGITPGQYVRFHMNELLMKMKLSDEDKKIVAERLIYGTTFKKNKGAK